MYAYEGAFSDSEAQVWLDRQLERYRQLGFGLWAVILKQTGEMIGQCGLTMQPWKGQELLKLGTLQPLLLALRLCHRSGAGVQAVRL